MKKSRRGEACLARSNIARQNGFSLLEVLITLSIISVSLLGFAQTELVSLKCEKDFKHVLMAE